MRERILTVALVVAVGVITYDRFALHLTKTHAAGKLVHIQPAIMDYPKATQLGVSGQVLGFSCTGVQEAPSARTNPALVMRPECFILVADSE